MTDFDAVVVGASLAGCATAIHLGRAGHRVALVDKRPDPAAYKRVCGHFIQSSAVPAIERLGVLDDLEAAGSGRLSTSATRCPARPRWIAVAQPASEAPTTTTSKSVMTSPRWFDLYGA